jgi:hypothetical protein
MIHQDHLSVRELNMLMGPREPGPSRLVVAVRAWSVVLVTCALWAGIYLAVTRII